MRIRHIAIITQNLEQTATFYEKVFGFKRLGAIRTPGNFIGKAIDMSDGEINCSLLCPNEPDRISSWQRKALGVNHIGIETNNIIEVIDSLKEYKIDIYGVDKQHYPPRFFKFLDLDGVEIDVATPERSWIF